jgi:hypothetical protein
VQCFVRGAQIKGAGLPEPPNNSVPFLSETQNTTEHESKQ